VKPDEARFAREWADALEEQGKYEDAETVLRRSLQAAPRDGETLARLGTLLLKQQGKWPKRKAC
jgi:Flp pilus assembly protein TadD